MQNQDQYGKIYPYMNRNSVLAEKAPTLEI